jgi:hypothetical protein
VHCALCSEQAKKDSKQVAANRRGWTFSNPTMHVKHFAFCKEIKKILYEKLCCAEMVSEISPKAKNSLHQNEIFSEACSEFLQQSLTFI